MFIRNLDCVASAIGCYCAYYAVKPSVSRSNNKINLIREFNRDISRNNFSMVNLKSLIHAHEAANRKYVNSITADDVVAGLTAISECK